MIPPKEWEEIAGEAASELFTEDDTWPGHCGHPDYIKLTKSRLKSIILSAIQKAHGEADLEERADVAANTREGQMPSRDDLIKQVAALEAKLNAPELISFRDGVILEAAHQRDRWASDHDAGKEPQDWFWLLGYLTGKALRAHIDGDADKALHHTISSAAALANWHSAILGANNIMQPGISAEKQPHLSEKDVSSNPEGVSSPKLQLCIDTLNRLKGYFCSIEHTDTRAKKWLLLINKVLKGDSGE